MTIGKRIEAIRKENNMSQRQLAEAMAVSRKAISRWESGEAEPDNVQLVLIARIFGVDVKALTKGTDHIAIVPKAPVVAEPEVKSTPDEKTAPEVQIVEKVVERVRVVEKPVVEYVETPVVKKIVRVKHQRNPVEFAIIGIVCFVIGLLIGLIF